MDKALDSGATVQINMAPFKDGHRLLQAVMREVGAVSVKDGQAEFLKNILSTLIASDAITEILWLCMGRCLYNGQKITKDTFDSEKARGDYLIVAKEVLEINLTPFLQNLGSLLRTSMASGISIPK